MQQVGNQWIDGGSNQIVSHGSWMHGVHVLLVDHETESLVSTVKTLEFYNYRVTIAQLASGAIQMMTSGKVKYDVVMANVNSPDLHGYKLVQHSVKMGIPAILMSCDDNTFMATKALENGAFLYIKKPATVELIGCLWQHVHREKTRIMREQEKLAAASRGIELGEQIHQDGGNLGNTRRNEIFMMRGKGKSTKNIKERPDNFNWNYNHHDSDNNKLKRKMCTEWTKELHTKFMNAVEILGEGRCYPREIMEVMNVPGLTRMQVASHLQKCRNENWRTPEERKAMNQGLCVGSSEAGVSLSKPRRFGSMPKICKVDHQTNGVKLSSQTRSETGSGMHANMENQYAMENDIVRHPVSGPFQPGPSVFPSNDMNQFNEFIDSPDMDYLFQELSRMPPSFVTNTTSQTHGQYHNEAVIFAEQNNVVQSMDGTTSPRSLEKSKFGSDDSTTRGHG